MSEAVLSTAEEQHQAARSWQVWSIAKQELLYLSWALMEIALLTPITLALIRWARFWPAGRMALWLLLLMLLPFNLVRVLSAMQAGKKTQRRILIISFLFTLFLSWRLLLFNQLPLFDFSWFGELFANIGGSTALWSRVLTLFLLILITWWRGLRLVQLQPDLHKVGLRLRIGILMFIPITFLPRSDGSAWGFLPFVLLYFLSGLTAVALIRAEQVERERSGFAASLSPRWVGTIILVSLLVVLTAGLFAVLVGGETLTLLLEWLSPVRMAFLAATSVAMGTAFYLATPLFFILELLITGLSNIFAALFSGLSENLGETAGFNLDGFNNFLPTEEETAEIVGFSIPPDVTRVLTILIMLAVVILVSFALTRRFRQASLSPQAGGPVRAAGRDSAPGDSLGQRILERLGFLRRWRTAASIRQFYQGMCDKAAAAGFTRSPSETPYEYLPTLAEVWPVNQEDTRLITEAYVRVRYGEIPETEEEVQAIRQAWGRLEESNPVELESR